MIFGNNKNDFKGYPIATVALYGPDSSLATKAVVAIIVLENDQEPAFMKRWYSENHDIRSDVDVEREILDFIKEHNAKSVVLTDGIIGCPHEEGKDYPAGSACPKCPYWENRDRFLDEVIN